VIYKQVEGLEGAFIVDLDIHQDSRGFLSEIWKEGKFLDLLEWKNFKLVQENFVTSNFGAIRGIHRTEKSHPQNKVLCCLNGNIVDYLVDLRPEYSSFKKVFKIELNSTKLQLLLVPKRIGHSFQTLSRTSVVCYFFDRIYKPSEEIGINPLDDELNIEWNEPYLISEKDKIAPNLREIPLEKL
jgi:dTDP-4-dehydrorhamnose 3,5-epimerase